MISEISETLEKKPECRSTILFLSIGWLNFIMSLSLMARLPLSIFHFGIFYLFTLALFISFLSVQAGSLHFFAEILSGGSETGTAASFFVLLAFSLLPLHFFLPLTLIAQGTQPGLAWPAWSGLFVWSGIRMNRAIRENYKFSTLKSVLMSAGLNFFIFTYFLLVAFAFFGFLMVKRSHAFLN